MAELQIKKQDSDAKIMDAKGRMQLDQAKLALDKEKMMAEGAGDEHERQNVDPAKMEELKLKAEDLKLKQAGLVQQAQKDKVDSVLQQQEMLAKERIQLIDLAQNLAVHPESAPLTEHVLGNIIPSINEAK
jgi:hypothetical protein